MFEKFVVYGEYIIGEDQSGQIVVIREDSDRKPCDDEEIRKIMMEIAKDTGRRCQKTWTREQLGTSLMKHIRKNKLIKKAAADDHEGIAREKKWVDWWETLHMSTKWFLLDSKDAFKQYDEEAWLNEPFGLKSEDMEYLKEQIRGLEIIRMHPPHT